MGPRRNSFAALLLLFPLFSQVPRATDVPIAKRLQQLTERIDEERKSWLAFRQQARSDEERAELRESFPRDEFVGQLEALASEGKGTEIAARAWLELYRLGCLLEDRALFGQAIERLTSEHVASPEMSGFALELAYGAPSWGTQSAAQGLRKILAGTTDANVRVGALVNLALLVGQDATLGAAGRDEARALLGRVEREFGDQDLMDQKGKDFAAHALYEIEHLSVGQVAPDWELTDQEGVRFKLSDYRGRVVLLDFWGFV